MRRKVENESGSAGSRGRYRWVRKGRMGGARSRQAFGNPPGISLAELEYTETHQTNTQRRRKMGNYREQNKKELFF